MCALACRGRPQDPARCSGPAQQNCWLRGVCSSGPRWGPCFGPRLPGPDGMCATHGAATDMPAGGPPPSCLITDALGLVHIAASCFRYGLLRPTCSTSAAWLPNMLCGKRGIGQDSLIPLLPWRPGLHGAKLTNFSACAGQQGRRHCDVDHVLQPAKDVQARGGSSQLRPHRLVQRF